jgi:multiple sugar transport system permease protein
LAYVVLVVYILPAYWIVRSSFETEKFLVVTQPQLGLIQPTLQNYASVIADAQYVRWFANSTILSLSTMVIAVATSSLAGYALARLRSRLSQVVSRFFFLAYIVPSVCLIIPLFVVLSDLGLQNTYVGLIITYTSFAIPFGTWLLRAYFASLPPELEDAALVDGCNRLTALFRIILPLAAPGIVTVALFSFVLAWNDVLFAIVFTRSEDMFTLTAGLMPMMESVVGGNSNPVPGAFGFGDLFAATVLVALPVLIVFILLQNWLIRGIAAGAVKG